MAPFRFLSVFALSALLIGSALAQSKPPPAGQQRGPGGPGGFQRRSPEERLKEFSAKLNLSAAQQKQVKAIWEKQSEKFRGMRDKMQSMKPEERLKKFEAIRKESQVAIRKILNPTQQKAYDKMVKEDEARRKQFMNRGPGGRGGPGGPPPKTGGGKSGGG